jgi:L-lactate dehydrogenase complex protein LldF
MSGMPENKHLSYASTLCGACTSVCPVKINIHNLLLLNRNQSVEQGLSDKPERMVFKFWLKAMKSRRLWDLVPSAAKNFLLRMVLKDTWSKKRSPVTLAPKSFRQLYKERKN